MRRARNRWPRCGSGRRGPRSSGTTRRSASATCATCSPRTRTAASGCRPRPSGSTSTTRRTGSPTRPCGCSLQLAEESGLEERRDAMFRGRAHQRLRGPRRAARRAADAPGRQPLVVDGVDVVAEVHEVLDRMAAFADRIRSGEWKGHTGKPIRNVVNVGIGGSDLGPVMAYEALRHYSRRDMTFRFVSNVDSTDFVEATRDLDRGRDAVHHLVEDVRHAGDADQRALGPRLGRRRRWATRPRWPSTSSPCPPTPSGWRSSASTPRTCSSFWDWVGGRYSMDSAIGLSTMIAIGPERLRRDARRLPRDGRALPHRAAGAEPARAHGPARASGTATSSAPQTVGVMPYEQYLKRFPAYLQQLTMESNGKHVTLDGVRGRLRHRRRSTGASRARTASTASTSSSTRAPTLIPVDLIGFGKTLNPLRDHHDILLVQRVRAGPGPGLRQDRGGGPGRGHAGGRRAAPGDGGQPADQRDPGRAAHARTGWARWSPCTSTACSRRGRSGASTRSTSGASSSARCWPWPDHPRAGERDRARADPRLVDQRPDPPLPLAEAEVGDRHDHGPPHAARDDRARPDGRQPRPPADARRPPLRGLRRQP